MDLQALAYIGEFVGAVGVIASLLYLAIQVKQAQRVARAENVREAQAAYSQVFRMLAEDGEVARIYETGCEDPDRLDPVELARFSHMLLLQFLAFVEIHTAFESGLMDAELYERWRGALAGHLQTPGGSRWWATARTQVKSDVVRSLEGLQGRVQTPREILEAIKSGASPTASAL